MFTHEQRVPNLTLNLTLNYIRGDSMVPNSPGRLPNQATLPHSAIGQWEIQNNPTMHYNNSNNTFLVLQFWTLNSYNYRSFEIYLYNDNTILSFFKWNNVICIFKTKLLRQPIKFSCCLKTFLPGQYFFRLVKVVEILYQINVEKESIPLLII